jgi:hypothetical protein
MKSFASPTVLASSLVIGFALSACTAADDGDSTTLESANAGLTMDDEAPMFGEPAAFEAAALEPERAYDDPMDGDPSVAEAREAPDGVAYRTLVLWGQMPPDRTVAEPTDWSGSFSVNRGAIVVRRTIGFEDRTDAVAPRTDRTSVEFTSQTRPAADGLVMAIFDPTPRSADPLTLTYRGAAGDVTVRIAELLEGRQTLIGDPAGNRMVAAAIGRVVDGCEHGFLRGRWHQGERGGVFRGVVTDVDLAPVGHVRGLYGTRASGEQVFFGKFIGLEGRFRGILAGHYGDGAFQGRWRTRAGDAGSLGGLYQEGDAEGEGFFLGRWAERTCNVELGGDAPL